MITWSIFAKRCRKCCKTGRNKCAFQKYQKYSWTIKALFKFQRIFCCKICVKLWQNKCNFWKIMFSLISAFQKVINWAIFKWYLTIVLSRKRTEISKTMLLFQKKNEHIERVLKNIWTIYNRTNVERTVIEWKERLGTRSKSSINIRNGWKLF